MNVPGPPHEGLLLYTPDGYVSANLLPKGREWTIETATLEELRQTVSEGSSTGYAGRYEIDPKDGTVTHIVSVSLDPADDGRRLIRNYSVAGDTLKLSGKWKYNGADRIFTVLWVRAKAGTKP